MRRDGRAELRCIRRSPSLGVVAGDGSSQQPAPGRSKLSSAWVAARVLVLLAVFFPSLWVTIPVGLVAWPFLTVVSRFVAEHGQWIGPRRSAAFVAAWPAYLLAGALSLRGEIDMARPALGASDMRWWDAADGLMSTP